MHFPVEGTRRTLLFFTVLTSWAIGQGKPAGDKTLNLRIGFDLTQGKNGAPALRIRDFEDSAESGRYPRAADEEKDADKVKPAIRADSFSDSKEEKTRHEDSSKEARQSSESEDGGYDSNANYRQKSTKGLNAEEYEPEDNVKLHGRYNEEEASDQEERRYRRRRQVDYESGKRKSKKVR